MTERRKSPRQSSPWFVEALFELPLAARQVLVTKYQLPVASDDLVLPSDEEQVPSPKDSIPTESESPIPLEQTSQKSPTLATSIVSSSEDLEADALRALMGYGRLARRKEGTHEC